MPSLGSALLRIRQKYGDGLRTACFRDRVRPRILNTRPVQCDQGGICEIHVLTSANDWLNLVWALKTFYHYSQRRYGLCIHEDGSLGPEAITAFRSHFPGAAIIDRKRANRDIETVLQDFPRCLQFRRTNLLAPKLFDFVYYLTTDRMLLLDSDILFFGEPRELLRRIEDPGYRLNTVNPDSESAYTIDAGQASRVCGVALLPRFNSGLGAIHRQSLRLDWLEEFLGLPGILEGHFWRIEQTLYALCSSRFGVELLPQEYAVRLDGGLNDQPCRHYVGAIRPRMYSEGIRHLVGNRFLATA
jgi:hypothetical protein